MSNPRQRAPVYIAIVHPHRVVSQGFPARQRRWRTLRRLVGTDNPSGFLDADVAMKNYSHVALSTAHYCVHHGQIIDPNFII